jgi:hypothetical protein
MFVVLLLLVVLAGSLACHPASVAPTADEKRVTTDEGWSFIVPKGLERTTAPGTTGFALHRPPPAKPILNIVFTSESFDGDTSAFVAKERAKVQIEKEQPKSGAVVVEETWALGDGQAGVALVSLQVVGGRGIRLACLGLRGPAFEADRTICERAVDSLLPPAAR